MKNGRFIVVYEVCGPEACNIYCKTSSDGINWPVGLGSRIHDQLGGPYVLSLNSGNLIVTSNSSQVSVSNDFGDTWKTINMAWQKTLWPSLYEIRENEIGAVNSVKREQGGNNIQFAWAIYNSNVLVPSLTPMEIYWRTARVPAAGKISPDKTALNLTIYLCLRASGSWVKNTKKPECSSPVPFIMHANARTGQVRYLASETGAGASRDRQAVHRWLHPVF